MTDTLSRAALNRALLARQLLLARADLPAEQALERLAGMQAQAPNPPYVGLWARLAGFAPEQLSQLVTERRVVRIALMRSTIHLVTAADCLLLRPVVQPALDRGLRNTYGRRLAGLDLDAVAAYGRELVEQAPLTYAELGERLTARWPDRDAAALAPVVRTLVPLVQVPPRGLWNTSGQAAHTSAETWLGSALPQASVDGAVLRYLAAYGPASVRDAQTWSGLTRLGEVFDRLRPRLVTFTDESGTTLYDLPDAPRPDAGTPAPVRLLGEFDNMLLSYADRSRILSEPYRARVFTANGIIRATVLVDGFVAGMWRLARTRDTASVTVDLFQPVSPAIRDELAAEAAALLTFAAPATTHTVHLP
ncbi:winged helix DNA-binding domain-containing protein [Catellatospora sp. KI3]|uniref:winged helix DNA-binding domain-containing protein n=1 Tax=Catellatospora sp. KI3 TaxID=3041620 RepID=UPI0024828F23|nr:winged helix DNA-binding domain-containing protein [Catellatospora sp. KI3]MDI1465985.1 winged helix DNA-binding domain-containing protein [Catellatospora sp. KI3]